MRTSQTIATNNQTALAGQASSTTASHKPKKPQSPHAAAAAMIRQHIKTLGIAAKVTSESYAGGSSVRVSVEDLTPATAKALEEYAGQFQYGHFDGMQDLYEYSNSRDDIPQVKFVFVNNRPTDEMRQRVWDWARNYYAGMEDAPADAAQAGSYMHAGMQLWGDNIIHRAFSGALEGFWK